MTIAAVNIRMRSQNKQQEANGVWLGAHILHNLAHSDGSIPDKSSSACASIASLVKGLWQRHSQQSGPSLPYIGKQLRYFWVHERLPKCSMLSCCGIAGLPWKPCPGGQHREHHTELVLWQPALHAHSQLPLPGWWGRHHPLKQVCS